jgi:hypothetical protein
MSFAAVKAVLAMDRATISASERMTLVAYAAHADDDGRTYPSHALLRRETSLNRKTLSAAVATMLRRGWLVDTGERKGVTQRVRVYRMNVPESGRVQSRQSSRHEEMSPKIASEQARNGTENRPENGTQKLQGIHKEVEADDTIPLEDWKPSEAEQAAARDSRPDVDTASLCAKMRRHYGQQRRPRREWSRIWAHWVKSERVIHHVDHSGRDGAARSVARADAVLAESRQAAKHATAPPDELMARYRATHPSLDQAADQDRPSNR